MIIHQYLGAGDEKRFIPEAAGGDNPALNLSFPESAQDAQILGGDLDSPATTFNSIF